LKEASVSTAKEILEKQNSSVNLQFQLMGYQCIPGEPSAWLDKSIESLETLLNKISLPDRYLFLYFIGMYYMADGKPDKALDYLNRVIISGDAEPFIFFTYSMVLTLEAHYDLGNYKLLPHMTRSMKRTLLRVNKFSNLEKAILAGFNRIALAKTVKDREEGIHYFLKKIEQAEYEEDEYHAELAITINSWLRSKIEKQPMLIFLRPLFVSNN